MDDYKDMEATASRELRTQFGLLTEQEVMALAEINHQTLQMWRVRGRGPVAVKLGRRVLYRIQDVTDWINNSLLTKNSSASADTHDEMVPA